MTWSMRPLVALADVGAAMSPDRPLPAGRTVLRGVDQIGVVTEAAQRRHQLLGEHEMTAARERRMGRHDENTRHLRALLYTRLFDVPARDRPIVAACEPGPCPRPQL